MEGSLKNSFENVSEIFFYNRLQYRVHLRWVYEFILSTDSFFKARNVLTSKEKIKLFLKISDNTTNIPLHLKFTRISSLILSDANKQYGTIV